MIRTVPVTADALGLVAAGQPDPLMVWEEQGGRRVLTDRQEKDETGALLWTAYVMPTQAERPEVLQVRITAPHQPVVTMFAPVVLDGLAVRFTVDKGGKLAQYWSAQGIRDAQGARRADKGEQAAA